MAKHNQNGGTVWLYIDPTGGTNYEDLVCLTDHSYSGSSSSSSTATYCGPVANPGSVSNTLQFNGITVLVPGTNNISAPDLLSLFQNGIRFSWKSAPASPQAGDEVMTGFGYLTALGKSYNSSDPAKFSGTITIDGLVTQTITPGS